MEKTHPEIPYGQYCYGITKINKETGKISTVTCPHWKSKLVNGWPVASCSLLNISSEQYATNSLIWDQVKDCDINKGEPGEE